MKPVMTGSMRPLEANYSRMKFTKFDRCPGTLAAGFGTYSPACLRNLFDGRKVSHVLPYEPPQQDEGVAALFMENRKRISISGVQEKLSLLSEKNQLRLTKAEEPGTYILKPIPTDLKNVAEVPANEHLTMQIARQVYGIRTAENALIFFKDGTPAYITKRFDARPEGGKWGKEDFATLAGKTSDSDGPDFKYESSYEAMGMLIRQYVPAWAVEIERFFRLVTFNYLFSNGDAHLKNFSLLETPAGDYLLSPAYDLVNTKIHVDDGDFGVNGGLFADGYKSRDYLKRGHFSQRDFYAFAQRIGIPAKRAEKIIKPFLEKQPAIESLIGRSFLTDATKRTYHLMYQTKKNYLLG